MRSAVLAVLVAYEGEAATFHVWGSQMEVF